MLYNRKKIAYYKNVTGCKENKIIMGREENFG